MQAGVYSAFTSTQKRLYFVTQSGEGAANKLVVYDQDLVRQTSEEFTFPVFGTFATRNVVLGIFVTGDNSTDTIYVITGETRGGVIDPDLDPDFRQFDNDRVRAYTKGGVQSSSMLWIEQRVVTDTVGYGATERDNSH